MWSGRALNLVFAALAVLAIFGLARALGFERLEGALVALVWAVSPAVVSVSSITRQYDLVALTTVLLVWGLVKACGAPPEQLEGERRPRTWPWLAVLWVAAAAAAALLTHYQAVLLVAGGAFYVVAGFLLARRNGRRRPWWPPLLGLAAGTLAAALLAPGWSGAFGRERSKLEHFSTKVLVEKLDAIAQTLGRFVGGPVLIIAAAVVVVVVLLLIPRTRRNIVRRVRTARPGWWTILYFAVFTAGAIILQNVLFLSMPPRISARYLAMAWPFLAFLPLLFFGLWPKARYALTAAFCLLVLVPVAIAAPLQHGGKDRMDLTGLAGADAVLVDNVGAGELPRFLWSVPADAPVFVGTQKEFLADQGAWSTADLGDKAYYVSILRSGGKYRDRNAILAELRRTHEVTQVATNGFVYIYEITPKAAVAESSGAGGSLPVAPGRRRQSAWLSAESRCSQRRSSRSLGSLTQKPNACWSPTRLALPSRVTSIQPCQRPARSSGHDDDTSMDWPAASVSGSSETRSRTVRPGPRMAMRMPSSSSGWPPVLVSVNQA